MVIHNHRFFFLSLYISEIVSELVLYKLKILYKPSLMSIQELQRQEEDDNPVNRICPSQNLKPFDY